MAPDPHIPRRRYPWHDDPDYDPSAYHREPPPQDARTQVPWSAAGPPPVAPPPPATETPPTRETPLPRKITVTRVAAMRGRQFAQGSVRAFQRAATADGADRSGLTALTYATMMTYAVDAAVAVALANTLFFAAAKAESITNVALYLAITAAPFAVIAPVIGPLLDRIQRGRRAALAFTFAGRAALAVVMAFEYHSWLLYPAALGSLVLSKSFVVLKAAVTPQVLPQAITLVTTNSRLTVFGMAAAAVFGGVAAGVAWLWDSPGALVFTAVLAVAGTVLCLRIPKWVESTAGEVPAALRSSRRGRRTPMGRRVAVSLWGNGAIRVLTGFLTLFVAFVVKQGGADARTQLLLIGMVGAAAGIGSFAGNAVGSRAPLGGAVVLWCVGGAVAVAVLGAVVPGIVTAAAVALVGATVSALAKVSLDAVIQHDLPEESRASAFGRSETVLQLAWVLGGALGVLLPHDTYWIGFTVVAVVVALAGIQTGLLHVGRSLLPFLAVREPPVAAPYCGPVITRRRASARGGAIVIGALLAACLVLAGCGTAAPPQVTFRAGAASVDARPTQYCDLKLQNCQSDANAPVELAVPTGTPLTVTVPGEISSAPWQVVFTYRSAAGAQTDGRSPVLAPDKHPDYQLVLPDATDRLLTAQVQQYGPAPQMSAETGEIEFPIRASWVLNVRA